MASQSVLGLQRKLLATLVAVLASFLAMGAPQVARAARAQRLVPTPIKRPPAKKPAPPPPKEEDECDCSDDNEDEDCDCSDDEEETASFHVEEDVLVASGLFMNALEVEAEDLPHGLSLGASWLAAASADPTRHLLEFTAGLALTDEWLTEAALYGGPASNGYSAPTLSTVGFIGARAGLYRLWELPHDRIIVVGGGLQLDHLDGGDRSSENLVPAPMTQGSVHASCEVFWDPWSLSIDAGLAFAANGTPPMSDADIHAAVAAFAGTAFPAKYALGITGAHDWEAWTLEVQLLRQTHLDDISGTSAQVRVRRKLPLGFSVVAGVGTQADDPSSAAPLNIEPFGTLGVAWDSTDVLHFGAGAKSSK